MQINEHNYLSSSFSSTFVMYFISFSAFECLSLIKADDFLSNYCVLNRDIK